MLLTGFTRTITDDPIIALDMAVWIQAQTTKVITYVEVHPTTVDVTGTIVSGDTSAIQSAIDTYVYAGSSSPSYIPTANMSNAIPMLDTSTKVVTSHAALTADNTVLALARRKAWVSGVLKQDSFVYYSAAVTNNGTVTFYITDDGTSTGNAVFKNVYADSITISPYGTTAVYQISSPTVAVNKKSITATVNQITSVILGLIQITNAANAVPCNLLVLGD